MTDPTTLDIHSAIKSKLDYFKSINKIPNIIFHGPSGSGKKTLVNDFIKAIYNDNIDVINLYVMYVNCAQGKGIKFIREDIKYFSKTNLGAAAGVAVMPRSNFKTIILLNADKLTNDAQSALRRCIEIFSENTRFFMIVEDKYNLLKPILSRFCEIHVPLPMIAINHSGILQLKTVNLHKFMVEQTQTAAAHKQETKRLYNLKVAVLAARSITDTGQLMDLCRAIYEKGYSALDLIHIIETDPIFMSQMGVGLDKKYELLLAFHKVKKEFRNECLMLYFILHFLYCGETAPLSAVAFI